MSARKLKRAMSDTDDELPPVADELGTKIAQAFIAGRLGDVHSLGTPTFRERTRREPFEQSWREAVERQGGTLTGFEVSNAGAIDLGFIPGLEEVAQTQFVAFVEIVFSTPAHPLDHDDAFTIGAVLLDEGQGPRIGALHAR